jgi:hypothetical protein
MSFVLFDQLTERSQRAAVDLAVVRQRTEVALRFDGCVEPLNEFPLGRCESFFAGDLHLPESIANVRLASRVSTLR